MCIRSAKNQRGYALLLVLLIIVLVGVAAPPIIANAINVVSQNQQTEEQIQLDHLEEMGTVYADAAIDEARRVTTAGFEVDGDQSVQDIIDEYKDDFASNLDEFLSEDIVLDEGRSVSVSDTSNETEAEGENELVIAFEITAVNGEAERTVEKSRSITITVE
ncbi:hypothetical protein [Alkalicoccus chagannorensis]|uniref:hypothetical protein n=1 Tax=Alkalicoccus chagannorensis TaxID=427072 RepID=UPI000411E0DD|nr:hypothetical protein [Alkalicoccus chagannorensis]